MRFINELIVLINNNNNKKVIWLHGGARNSVWLPDPVQWQNLELWLKECVKYYG
jgi:hypothetical protein